MKKDSVVSWLVLALFLARFWYGPEYSMSKATGIHKYQVREAIALLHDIGMEKIGDTVVLDKNKGMYYVDDEKYGRVFFYIKDGVIDRIESEQGVPIVESGEIKMQLNEGALTADEVNEFRDEAQEAIKKKLEAPSTLNFTNVMPRKTKNRVVVTGEVDAQNNLSTQIHTHFTVNINYSDHKVIEVLMN